MKTLLSSEVKTVSGGISTSVVAGVIAGNDVGGTVLLLAISFYYFGLYWEPLKNE